MISLLISEEIMRIAVEKTRTGKGDCGHLLEDLNARLWSMSFSKLKYLIEAWLKKMKYLIEVL